MHLRPALAALVLGLLAPSLLAAAEGPPDPGSVPIWQQLRKHLFDHRPIYHDPTGVVRLRVPARAQDPSVVPVSISIGFEQTEERYVRTLYLIIDANPSPLGVKFSLTPLTGLAEIETRVRIEDYGWVRAIAEMSDGSLFVDQHYVKAAGGCSAPAGATGDFEAFQPRAELELRASDRHPGMTLAQLRVRHPNSSGLARDPMTRLFIPPYFVREIEVTLDGETVLRAQTDFTLSANPNIRLHFKAGEPREVRAVVVDTRDRRVEATEDLEAIAR